MCYMPHKKIDNQHATLQLSWLAGILDGEGSFMIIRSKRNGKFRYFYRISIANTNELIVNECKRILDRLKIKYCCYYQDRRGIKTLRRQTYLIHITNRDGIICLCKPVINYLVGKKKIAKNLLKIVSNWQKYQKDKKESFYQEFKKANQRIPKKL